VNVTRQIKNPESGASLVEILVAVAIISSALTIFVAALSTGAFAVRTSNRLTTATNLASVQLETIKAAPYNPAGYAAMSAPSNYAINISSSVIITGLQQVTVTVSYQGDSLVTVGNYKVNR
jgi:Tfp pilus assembly protein PilV